MDLGTPCRRTGLWKSSCLIALSRRTNWPSASRRRSGGTCIARRSRFLEMLKLYQVLLEHKETPPIIVHRSIESGPAEDAGDGRRRRGDRGGPEDHAGGRGGQEDEGRGHRRGRLGVLKCGGELDFDATRLHERRREFRTASTESSMRRVTKETTSSPSDGHARVDRHAPRYERAIPAQVAEKPSRMRFVEGETAKAEKEAALVAVIQKDVGEKQRRRPRTWRRPSPPSRRPWPPSTRSTPNPSRSARA